MGFLDASLFAAYVLFVFAVATGNPALTRVYIRATLLLERKRVHDEHI